MDLIPVENNKGLARDKKSGAIININKSEVEKARERKRARKAKQEEYEELKETVAQLNDDISEIKELLKRLVG